MVAYYAWGMDGLVAVVRKVADIAIAVMAAISAIAVPCVAQDGIMAGYVAGEKLTEEVHKVWFSATAHSASATFLVFPTPCRPHKPAAGRWFLDGERVCHPAPWLKQ